MALDARAADPNESESARALREKKRVLAALVVHDLRSPLSAIQGYLGLLREELGPQDAGNAQALAYIEDATTLVGKALGLVSTILDVDELEDGPSIIMQVRSSREERSRRPHDDGPRPRRDDGERPRRDDGERPRRDEGERPRRAAERTDREASGDAASDAE